MAGEKYEFEFVNFFLADTDFQLSLKLNDAYVEVYKTKPMEQKKDESSSSSSSLFDGGGDGIKNFSKKRKLSTYIFTAIQRIAPASSYPICFFFYVCS